MAAGRPWWQPAKTARQGFVFGSLWGLLGMGELLSIVVRGGADWELVLSAGMLALAGAYLTTAVALLRRERQGKGGGPGGAGEA